MIVKHWRRKELNRRVRKQKGYKEIMNKILDSLHIQSNMIEHDIMIYGKWIVTENGERIDPKIVYSPLPNGGKHEDN